MEDYSKKRLYRRYIIKILRENKKTLDELLTEINTILKNEWGIESISKSTFERAKKSLNDDGYQIRSKKIQRKNYFVLEGFPENMSLTEEEKLTFPLLIGLLETEKKMASVEWLKSTLMDDFGYSDKDLKSYPYFVNAQPTLNSQDDLLMLAGKIIEYIKKGQAILFQYQKKGITSFKQVAPLQIRYYDNRYYLLASTIDDITYKPTNLLQTFTLDMFVEKNVNPALDESDENATEPNYIFFDYETLYKATRLEELLKHCLGIWYDYKENNLKTYRLKFTDWTMGIVKNKKIHPSQKIIQDTSENLIIEINVWENHEIDYFLGRFGDKCERLN